MLSTAKLTATSRAACVKREREREREREVVAVESMAMLAKWRRS